MYNKLYTGPMFSGKTRRLVNDLERFVIAKQHIAWFEPKRDTRGGSHGGYISTRMAELKNSSYVHSLFITDPSEIIKTVERFKRTLDIKCIFIDEFFMIPFERQFFFDYQNSSLKDIPMVFAGLTVGWDSNVIKTALNVIPFMDEIKKSDAICMNCGKPANYSYFVGNWDTSDPIDNGTNYKCLCADCYMKEIKEPITASFKG